MISDPYYVRCCITGSGKNIQWHHVFTFAGKSIQEKWAIVPVTKEVHDQCTQHKPEYDRNMAEKVELIALERATDEELEQYSKVIDLKKRRDELQRYYGKCPHKN